MPTITLMFTIEGPDQLALLREVGRWDAFTRSLPEEITHDFDDVPVDAAWLARLAPTTKRKLYASWGGSTEPYLFYRPPDGVQAAIPDTPADPREILERFASLPFTFAAFSPIHRDWASGGTYWPPTLGALHSMLGWGCLFKGAGHERLVSRRWLDHGPWRVLRGPHDTTLVQFHDLAADSATAIEQAAPGHARFVGDGGGYLRPGTPYEVNSIYSAELQLSEIIVAGRDVTARELHEAAAFRRAARASARPVDRLAYVFIDTTDAPARAHLHELWLRDIECWAVVDGRRFRLDADYHPPAAPPPAWAR